MISFTRGLVLRRGERTLEFERDLGNGEVQFKHLDNFEVKTFSMAKILKEIIYGTYQIVHSRTSLASRPDEVKDMDFVVLPARITSAQEALISFRMHYVKAALRMRATAGSHGQCSRVLKATKRPSGADDAESKLLESIKTPSPATLMRWLMIYQRSGNNPYLLCDRRALVIKPKKLCRVVEQIIEDAITRHYLQLRGKSIRDTWRHAVQMVQSTNRRDGATLQEPSVRTVNRRVLEIPEFIRDSKRFGLGYARNKWRYSLKGDQSTRILERVEIDHTMLDVWVLDPISGVPLGRPWITVVIDRMSGYILGVYISFYGPSCASVANAIKVAIFPKDDIVSAIPDIQTRWTAMGVAELYVVDNGLEFHSHTFRRIAWELRADLLYNPVHQPWLKSAIERSMMEFNRMLPWQGKVFAPVKNMLPIDPRKSAAILFDDFCAAVIHWAAEVHPNKIHPKTLVRPIDFWEEGRELAPPAMFPPSIKNLELATGISTQRTIDGDGVFFQYMRYNSVELQDYCRSHGRKFRSEVRFNPDDLGQMHVHLPKASEWINVPLQRPTQAYGSGLSLIQHQINREEAGKKLTRANAEVELEHARQRNIDRWSEALRKGVKVRKHSDLIRYQGYTSVKLYRGTTENPTPAATPILPEASQISTELLADVMPFRAFSLDEELE